MNRPGIVQLLPWLLAVGVVWGAPAAGEGFAVFEQAAAATGLGGAFVARADDPSAVFYNPGGLGLLGKKPKTSVGLATVQLQETVFQGRSPGIAAGTTAQQEAQTLLAPHAFLVMPLAANTKLGVGVYSPFLLATRWAAPDAFAGRYLALDADLVTYDVNTSVGVAVSPSLGIGAGVIYRTSELQMSRRLPGPTPSGDIADLDVDTAFADGFGWTAGILRRGVYSWGLAYTSAIQLDLSGTGRLTQILSGDDQLDALIAASLPFDQDLGLTSSIELPDRLTLGLGFQLTRAVALEIDASRVGWSGFTGVALTFANDPTLDDALIGPFDDSTSYRLGLLYELPSGLKLRLGAAFEESPVPDEEVGPLFVDADRTTITLGLGKDWLDMAFVWTDLASRTVTTNRDDFQGSYGGSSWTLVVTASK